MGGEQTGKESAPDEEVLSAEVGNGIENNLGRNLLKMKKCFPQE